KSEPVFAIVIVVHTHGDGTDRRMHDQACSTGKVNVSEALRQHCFLIGAFQQRLEWLERVRFKSQVESVSQSENVSESAGNKVEGAESVKHERRAILQRTEIRGVDQGAVIVSEERLIGEYRFRKEAGAIPSGAEVFFGGELEPEPLVMLLYRCGFNRCVSRLQMFTQVKVLESDFHRSPVISILFPVEAIGGENQFRLETSGR